MLHEQDLNFVYKLLVDLIARQFSLSCDCLVGIFKNRTGISSFCSLSRGVTLVAPSYLLANSLILADVLSADCSART